jgi:hypothetical protein
VNLVRELCVQGHHPIFGLPNIGVHRVSANKATHDATTEEIEEEHYR